MSVGLDRLRDVLLVQSGRDDADAALDLAARPGDSVVVSTMDHRNVLAFAAIADGRPLLVDASRYAGNRWHLASAPFDRGWPATQREAGLPVLTDSGYVAEHDEAGLVSVLERAAGLGDVIATLALHRGGSTGRVAWAT